MKNSHKGSGKHCLRGKSRMPRSRNQSWQSFPTRHQQDYFQRWRHGSRIFRPQETPLLGSLHKPNPHIGASVNLIPLSMLQATEILECKIQGCPMEITGFGRKGKYTAGLIQLWLKVVPIVSLAHFNVVKTEVSYHILLGRPWLHKYRLVLSTY